MSEPLTLEPLPATLVDSDHDVSRIHVYESSMTHSVTAEPLVSIATRGRGMRLTREQAEELRDWLTGWLA